MIIDAHFHGYPKGLKPPLDGIIKKPVNIFDVDEYLKIMDQYGIDLGVLSMPSGNPYSLDDREKSLDIAKLVNDTFAEVCQKHPDRFKAFAHLPLKDPESCLKEMDRALGEMNLSGVCIPTNVGGESLDEEKFTPFFEEVNKRRTPIFMHPVNAPCDKRWQRYSLPVRIVWLSESTLAIYSMVASGLFDRFPDFPFIVPHLGGLIHYYIDRLNRKSDDLICLEAPEAYFKKFYYDTAGPVRGYAIKCACEFAGTTQVIFGTDYPFGEEGDEGFIAKTLRAMEEVDLNSEEKELIYHKNIERILGFEEGEK